MYRRQLRQGYKDWVDSWDLRRRGWGGFFARLCGGRRRNRWVVQLKLGDMKKLHGSGSVWAARVQTLQDYPLHWRQRVQWTCDPASCKVGAGGCSGLKAIPCPQPWWLVSGHDKHLNGVAGTWQPPAGGVSWVPDLLTLLKPVLKGLLLVRPSRGTWAAGSQVRTEKVLARLLAGLANSMHTQPNGRNWQRVKRKWPISWILRLVWPFVCGWLLEKETDGHI